MKPPRALGVRDEVLAKIVAEYDEVIQHISQNDHTSSEIGSNFMTSEQDRVDLAEFLDDEQLQSCLTDKNNDCPPPFVFNEVYPVADIALLCMQHVSKTPL